MKIIIAGAGNVGTHLAELLSNENHDIALIDNNEEHLKEAASSIDLITFLGSATRINTLLASGIAKADLFISVTRNESVNITASVLGKKLGAKKSIARIDNLEYLEQEFTGYFTDMGIDYMFYPELIAANELVSLIQQTGTTDNVIFGGGNLMLFAFKVESGDAILKLTVTEFNNKKGNGEFRILAYTRNNETLFPENDTVLIEGDQVYVITSNTGRAELMSYFGKENEIVKNIMILGGSRIGKNAAKQLGGKLNVKLIEQDRSKSYILSNDLKGTLVINGDGRNVDLLLEEGLTQMDVFIAVTGDSETNMLSCLLAKRMGVKRTIAEIENTDYIKLAENMGIDNILNKKLITASKIHRFTVSDDVSSVRYLSGTNAEVVEFIAKPDSRITQGSLHEINFPSKVVIGGIVRGRNVIIPNDDIQIRPFDRVVVFAMPEQVSKLARFFTSNDRFF